MRHSVLLIWASATGLGCTSVLGYESEYTLGTDSGAAEDVSTDGGAGSGGGGGDASEEDGAVDCDAGATGVGVVGEPCCPANALACAGHAQKLVLFCSPKSGEWEALQSCSGNLLCDTAAGVNQGTCQEPVAACVGKQPGDKFCDGTTAVECGPDLLTTTQVTCGNACVDGECSGKCVPGTRDCDAATPRKCGDDGQWQSSAPCPFVCLDGQCGGLCTPGSKQCDGKVPQTCDAKGEWEAGTACPSVCAEGVCVSSCTEGTKQCSNLTLQTCVGGVWQDTQSCLYVCSKGACSGVCAPGSKQCDGKVAQTCDAAGQWQDGLTCPYLCTAGSCAGECAPGSKLCNGLTPRVCDSAGVWQSSAPCTYVCSGGDCSGVCTPGSKQCNGKVPQTCDATGQWQSSAACPYLCTAGTCTGACSPGSKQCNGLVPQTCNAGGSWDDGPACSYVCKSGACAGVCSPGSKQCNGQSPQTCDANGVWQGTVACQNQACANGACTGVCAPGRTRCSSNAVQTCGASGQWDSNMICTGATSLCEDGVCVAASTHGPSCAGLAETCGPGKDESCCASKVVPGGTFNRGNDSEAPATVSDFRMDRFEITVGRMRKFVAVYDPSAFVAGMGKNPNNPSDTGWDPAWNAMLPADKAALTAELNTWPSVATWTSNPGVRENHPINMVSWVVAQAFCIWDGGRLPTEAEWNYAAAGGAEQREYPWSSPPSSKTIDCSYANYLHECEGDFAAAVGKLSPKGDSKWLLADLEGNLSEWVLDGYSYAYPVPCVDCGTASSSVRMLRGGHFNSGPWETTAKHRTQDPVQALDNWNGARCVRNP